MKKRYIQRVFDCDENEINLLAEQYGFDEKSAFLLRKYHVTAQNAQEFFAEEGILFDPFLMLNMKEAVDKINEYAEAGKKILIFGDYDADGISASAILKLFFDANGIDSVVYLPKRSDGYGLKIETLMRLFNSEKFDLVLTVDCGITAVDEVEFVQKILRREVVVTDHHEPSEKLPNCICVNPKLGYPFRNLSGSGVAMKLVQAMAGEEIAKGFCDLAAIGTVADVMPLESENRSIVKFGCAHVNNIGLKSLLSALKTNLADFDCTALALKVCPKINAAGRIDSPDAALELLLAADAQTAASKVKKLLEANNKRQLLTEQTTEEAEKYIVDNNLQDKSAIFVYGDNWKHGILGLVANRLMEKYKVPVGAFMPDEDNIVGSLRAPESVNLFEIATQLKRFLSKFGGHKQSVGATLPKECFDGFYDAFVKKTDELSGKSTEKYYDAVFCPEYLGESFLSASKKFEPIAANDHAVFYGEFSVKNLVTFGKNKNFVKILADDNFELKSFKDCGMLLPALKTNCNIACLFTIEYDDFEGKYVGNISDMSLLDSVTYDDIYLCNYVDSLSFGKADGEEKYVTLDGIRHFASDGGCCCVFGSMLEFEHYAEKTNFDDFYLDFFVPSQYENTVLISPSKNADLSKFKSVIYFNRYDASIEKKRCGNNVMVCSEKNQTPAYLYGQKIDRSVCARIFRAISGNLDGCADAYELYLKCGVFEHTFGTFLYVLKIFQELNILELSEKPFKISIIKGVKVDLNNSHLFNMIAAQ